MEALEGIDPVGDELGRDAALAEDLPNEAAPTRIVFNYQCSGISHGPPPSAKTGGM